MTFPVRIDQTIRAALAAKGISKQELIRRLVAKHGLKPNSVKRQVDRWTREDGDPPTISDGWADRLGEELDQPEGWLATRTPGRSAGGGGQTVFATKEDLESLRSELEELKARLSRGEGPLHPRSSPAAPAAPDKSSSARRR